MDQAKVQDCHLSFKNFKGLVGVYRSEKAKDAKDTISLRLKIKRVWSKAYVSFRLKPAREIE